ncbi:MAG: peptidylprolyl isomerase [Christensenellales bacterium]|jgi:parvulin-like peptidyl-prolyl isomerase
MRKLTTLLLVLLMMFNAALAEETTSRVLATVEDTQIYQSQADEIMPAFVDYNYINTESDYNTVVKYLVQEEIMRRKIADMKFDQFSPEELEAMQEDAKNEWENFLSMYVAQNISEDTQEAKDAARQRGEEYLAANGLSQEKILESIKRNESINKMRDYLLGGYSPTDQEIEELFKTVGEQYKEQYENNIPMYETMTTYYGQPSWYTPEGYRGIIHILIKVDEDVLEHYIAMQAAYEEQHREENAENAEEADGEQEEETADVVTEPVLLEQIEEARQAVLDSQKETIDKIYDRLADGESFEKLIEEFGQDPGMLNADTVRDGYPVHKESIIYDPAFTKAAFSEKMNEVGDVSDPVVGSFGIHILKYQRDVPSGLIMTDAIHEEISNVLIMQKENEVFSQALASWESTLNINYNEENIELATKEAEARMAQEDKSGEKDEDLEAVSPEAETEGN